MINSLEKIQENLSSFSHERRVCFIDFLKEVSRSRDFYCWSNSLFQSLGPRDETFGIIYNVTLIKNSKVQFPKVTMSEPIVSTEQA